MSEYIYRCEKQGETRLVGPNTELLTTAPMKVRCSCGEYHHVFPIFGLPWEGGPPAQPNLIFWPTCPFLNGIQVHPLKGQNMTPL